MVEVTKEELREVVDAFQNDNIPGFDGWIFEFYIGFYDFLGDDFLDIVQESRKIW